MLEGPKLHKRNGYYYVFAPSGGVSTGYQAVFRAKDIRGPYEHRVVLDQGSTAINGPHQGAWVDTPTDEDWFLHFQDAGAYGRVIHLQPMVWRNDWPVIGADPDQDGKGEPVLTHRKPDVGRRYPPAEPQTSDEFSAASLGLQWQWNANPRSEWFSLLARPGFLRLTNVPLPGTRNDGTPAPNSPYDAPNFLLQKFPAPEFTVTTALEFFSTNVGDAAGLTVFGFDYSILALQRTTSGVRLVLIVNQGADKPGAEEHEVAGVPVRTGKIYLRVNVRKVGSDAICDFAYSFDNESFTSFGGTFKASVDKWMGAKIGLIANARPGGRESGYADFDWFHVEPLTR